MEATKEFSKTVLTLDNCVVPRDRLLNTPSQQDGVSHELEVDLRLVGCEYIQTAGLLLKLPQVAMATAQVLFHRFYYSKSFVKYSLQAMAMACVFVAAKIEEDCRRIRDVINVFHHLRKKCSGKSPVPMEYMGEEYFKLKATVIKYERFLLKELGFCVHVKHPHRLIITYLQMLDMEKNSSLAQRSWNFMNDSLRSNVFVRFSPETIACACIFLAARQLKMPLPQSPPWWLLFDAHYEDIEDICLEVLSLYRRPKVFLEQLEKKIAVHKEELQKKQVEIKEVKVKKSDPDSASKKAGLLPTPGSTTKVSTSDKPRPPNLPSQEHPPPKPTTSSSSALPHSHNSKATSSSSTSHATNSTKPQTTLSPMSSPRGSQTQSRQPDEEKEGEGSSNRSSPSEASGSLLSCTPSPTRRANTPRAYKPIISPIMMSPASDSPPLTPPSPLTTSLLQANGIEVRARDRSHDRRVRKSRHKHRTERRERSREKTRRRHRHGHHHREKEERERGERGWRERDGYLYKKRDRDSHEFYEYHSRRRDPYRR